MKQILTLSAGALVVVEVLAAGADAADVGGAGGVGHTLTFGCARLAGQDGCT